MNTARPWLLADIGGSRTRIGILNDRDEITAIRVLSNDALPDLVSALRSYLEEGTQPSIRAGALAVAAPIVEDRVRMIRSRLVLFYPGNQGGPRLGAHRGDQ